MIKSFLAAVVAAVFLSIFTAGTVVLLGNPALAERPGEVPVSNKTAAELMSSCLVTQDNKFKSGKSYDRCCSKRLGYCIKCPKTGGTCVESPYRINEPLEDNAGGGDVLAPVQDEITPSRPGTTPKLQLNTPNSDVLAPSPTTAPTRPATAPKLQIQ